MKPILVSLLLCVFSVVARADEPSASFASYTGNDLFPSFIISTATVDWNEEEQIAEDKKTDQDPPLEEGDTPLFGDENGSVGVEIENVAAGSKITVEIEGEGFLKPSKWEGTIDEDYDVVEIYPKAIWDYDTLRRCTQQKPANLTINVTINDEALPTIEETVVLRSINDCPFYVAIESIEDGAEETAIDDISVTFAAYVNEDHPWIDGLLKEALASAKEGQIINSFDGYQSKDPEVVISQVFAVWNALQRRGIKYSDISTAPPSELVHSQSVRYLDDTINSSQANCVDGSVLMASILRKIGLDAYLIMVPGHCFLAFTDGDKENPTFYGLETTMLGQNDLKAVKDLPNLSDKLKQEEFAASFETFAAAMEAGNAQLKEHAEALLSEENPDIQAISISEARAMGVMPIGAADPKK